MSSNSSKAATRSLTLFRSLSYRSFALLWSGQTISRLGDSLYSIALAWWVLQQTGSAAAMGLVLIAANIPQLLLSLIGGVVSDRLPRVSVMLAADLLRGLVVGVVALGAAQALGARPRLRCVLLPPVPPCVSHRQDRTSMLSCRRGGSSKRPA